MKSLLSLVLSGTCLLCVCDTGGSSEGKVLLLETAKDSVSYVIGTDIARSLTGFKDEIDLDVLKRGLQDQLYDNELMVTPEAARELMVSFTSNMRKKQQAESEATGVKNEKEGIEFLAENKKNENVVTTGSGLQYIVLKKGGGPVPAPSDKVRVHYEGKTLDGKVFDSSYERGEPVEFPVKGVIKGWTEALQLMPVGSKYRIFVPADLAYGTRGAGPDIGPNAVLSFEIELLDIVKE